MVFNYLTTGKPFFSISPLVNSFTLLAELILVVYVRALSLCIYLFIWTALKFTFITWLSVQSCWGHGETSDFHLQSIFRWFTGNNEMRGHSSCCLSEDNQDLFDPVQPWAYCCCWWRENFIALCISIQTPVWRMKWTTACNKCQHLCRYVGDFWGLFCHLIQGWLVDLHLQRIVKWLNMTEIRLTQNKRVCSSLTEIICGKIWTISNQTLGSKRPLDPSVGWIRSEPAAQSATHTSSSVYVDCAIVSFLLQ